MSESVSKPALAKFFKIGLFMVLILAPVLAVMIIFRSLATKKTEQIIRDRYSLPHDYTKEDVIIVVNRMRNDPEFKYYFVTLNEDNIAKATAEAIEILEEKRERRALLKAIEQVTENVLQASLFFNHLNFPEEFYARPADFPELGYALWVFLTEEFKLSILGSCYKSTYDPTFIFAWDAATKVSAEKLKIIVDKLYAFQASRR